MMKFNKISQVYRQLNDFIRGELKRQKMSQKDLGYSLNLSQQVISKRLMGKIDWTLWEFINALDDLGYEIEIKRKE